jgi:hypothetical protein
LVSVEGSLFDYSIILSMAESPSLLFNVGSSRSGKDWSNSDCSKSRNSFIRSGIMSGLNMAPNINVCIVFNEALLTDTACILPLVY